MAVILQISAGQGPEECKVFVVQLAGIIAQEAAACGLSCSGLTDKFDKLKSASSLRFAVSGEALEVFRSRWSGTVRWIWQSTIRPHWQRKNWFVKVSFFEFANNARSDFRSSDLKITACRASGPGGQHVNTTDSAVKVIHLPSGTEAQASEERSQSRNRELALLRLQEKLHLISEQQRAAEKNTLWHEHYQLERGKAIRTYKGLPPQEV